MSRIRTRHAQGRIAALGLSIGLAAACSDDSANQTLGALTTPSETAPSEAAPVEGMPSVPALPVESSPPGETPMATTMPTAPPAVTVPVVDPGAPEGTAPAPTAVPTAPAPTAPVPVPATTMPMPEQDAGVAPPPPAPTAVPTAPATVPVVPAPEQDAGAPPEPPPEPVVEPTPTEAELLTGEWETLNTNGSPTRRHECGFGEVNGKMYLVGGRGNKNTDIYDPATNTWRAAARPLIELHHFQPVSFEGKLYVAGALTGNFPREDPVPDFHIYDPEENEWSRGPRLPEGRERGAAGAVIYQDKFYIVSGITDGHHSGWVTWFDMYDPATNEWETLPDTPIARDHVAVAVAGDKLYVAGGRQSARIDNDVFGRTIAQVDMFDLKTNTWTTLPNDIPTQRAGNSTTILGNHLLILGGERAGGGGGAEAVDAVEAMNLTTHEWITLPSLNRNRHATSVVVFDEKMYTAAGSGAGGGSPELTSLERWSLP